MEKIQNGGDRKPKYRSVSSESEDIQLDGVLQSNEDDGNSGLQLAPTSNEDEGYFPSRPEKMATSLLQPEEYERLLQPFKKRRYKRNKPNDKIQENAPDHDGNVEHISSLTAAAALQHPIVQEGSSIADAGGGGTTTVSSSEGSNVALYFSPSRQFNQAVDTTSSSNKKNDTSSMIGTQDTNTGHHETTSVIRQINTSRAAGKNPPTSNIRAMHASLSHNQYHPADASRRNIVISGDSVTKRHEVQKSTPSSVVLGDTITDGGSLVSVSLPGDTEIDGNTKTGRNPLCLNITNQNRNVNNRYHYGQLSSNVRAANTNERRAHSPSSPTGSSSSSSSSNTEENGFVVPSNDFIVAIDDSSVIYGSRAYLPTMTQAGAAPPPAYFEFSTTNAASSASTITGLPPWMRGAACSGNVQGDVTTLSNAWQTRSRQSNNVNGRPGLHATRRLGGPHGDESSGEDMSRKIGRNARREQP